MNESSEALESSPASGKRTIGSAAPEATTRVLDWISLLTFGIVVSSYLALVLLGQWQADEYHYFGWLKLNAWQAILARIRWSPRPLSEALYLGYGLISNQVRAPLAGIFLAILWAGLLVCALLNASLSSTRETPSRLPSWLLGLGLTAAFLTSGPAFEVFYWPAGAVAYLPTLSATLLLFLTAIHSSTSRLIFFTCLVVASASSEMGAIFVACFCALQAGRWVYEWRRSRVLDVAAELWWLLPGLLAAGVLLAVALNRMQATELVTTPSATLHNPLTSTVAAVRQLLLEILGFDAGTHRAMAALPKFISRLAFATGFALVYLRLRSLSKAAKGAVLLLAGAFTVAALVSLAGGYSHFGSATGQRYETLRRCWILMSLSGGAIVLFGSAPFSAVRQRMSRPWIAPFLLAFGVLVPWHVTPLVREYSVYLEVRRCIRENFRSGYAPGEEMTFVTPPNRGVMHPETLPSGIYTPDGPPTAYDYAAHILNYFGKRRMVVPSEQ